MIFFSAGKSLEIKELSNDFEPEDVPTKEPQSQTYMLTSGQNMKTILTTVNSVTTRVTGRLN